MMLDIIILILLAIAIFKGLKNGLVMAVFSLLGVVLGIAAAIKLSAVTAKKLSDSDHVWLPFISFLLVFVVVATAVALIGRIIQKTVSLAMMGWLNKLGGVVFYLALYILIITVFLFYISNLPWFPEKLTANSVLYKEYEKIGPSIISGVDKLFPFFEDAFEDLKLFFGTFETKI